MNTILDYLNHWVAVQPNKCFASFLDVRGNPKETHTFRSFDLRSRFLAEHLRLEVGIGPADRVVLMYSPGLEMVAAFVACARIGAIPVPVSPPRSWGSDRGTSRLESVLRDSGATVVLTDSRILESRRAGLTTPERSAGECTLTAEIIRWIATDQVSGVVSGGVRDDPGEILFLQYTSGSTGVPKGVVVSHRNVIHNCHAAANHQPIGVCWLPQFHDMGMIGYYVFQLVIGGTTYGFSPMDFLRRPVLWLETLSRFQGTFTSAPNFGFEYCLSEQRVPREELTDLDLSSVQVLMNASEPARPSTYHRFLDRFAPYGLRPEAHVVAYGLAENTLAVSGHGRRTLALDRPALHRRSVEIVDDLEPAARRLELMSCGRPLDGVHVRIVDPETRAVVEDKEVGEIWLAGQSKCQGYWNRPEMSEQVFRNSITNDPDDDRSYLRTGDLGFLDGGEIFVCGRLKDMIILRGRNYYAEDLERAVEVSSDRVRPGRVVAFGAEHDEDGLVVLVGVTRSDDLPDPDDITGALRSHEYDGRHTIVFVRHQVIARTTSGKLARRRTRENWLAGAVTAIATHVRGFDGDTGPGGPEIGLLSWYERFLRSFSLSADDGRTLPEAGLDSLAIVELLVGLEAVVEERAGSQFGEALDAAVLQRLTVSDLTAVVKGLDRDDVGAVTELQRALLRFKEEREAADRVAMRRDSQLEAIGTPGMSATTRQPVEDILLTGGTGFLGPFLLQSLLDQTHANYAVLVRGTDPFAARERLRECLRRTGLFTASTNEAFEARVRVICGNLAQPNLGLTDQTWTALASSVDSIIHNGALVDYVLTYDGTRAANVEGTRQLLHLAATSRRKRFHLVSSTMIFGWSVKKELAERDSNDEMAELDFGYAQSKWVAEQLALAAGRQGHDVRVYRPSFLTASTSGFGNPDDMVVRLLAFMINHGIAPATQNQISFMPVDIAAHNMAAIIADPQAAGPVFHLTVNKYYNLTDVTSIMSRDYGIPFRYVSLAEFAADMRRMCVKDDPAYPLLDFVLRSHSKIATLQQKRYSNTTFRAALARTGKGRADASLQDTVSYLVNYMRSQRIIHRP
jgi:thioester reductase-like protein